MDKVTMQRISNAHPRIKELLLKQYKEINNQLPKGVRLRFSRVFSTEKEQNELYAQGRTTEGSIVTNARGGQSIHNYGLAFDIVILLDKDNNGSFEQAVWSGEHFYKVVKYFKSKGYEWGGDWKIVDKPHFQITFNHTWRTLKAKIEKGQYIESSNNFKYPLL